MSDTSKISAFSVLQIPGQAEARLLTWLTISWMTWDFVPNNTEQFCYWESIFYWPRGKTKCFALNFQADPNKVSTDAEWAEVGWNFDLLFCDFCLDFLFFGCHIPLPHERLGCFSWKSEATIVEMQSHQSRDIVLRQPLPKSCSVMEHTSVTASHWICSSVHWDKDFNNTGSSILIIFCLISSAVMHWLLPKSFYCTESTIF